MAVPDLVAISVHEAAIALRVPLLPKDVPRVLTLQHLAQKISPLALSVPLARTVTNQDCGSQQESVTVVTTVQPVSLSAGPVPTYALQERSAAMVQHGTNHVVQAQCRQTLAPLSVFPALWAINAKL